MRSRDTQFIGNRRSRTAYERPGIAATGMDRAIAEGVAWRKGRDLFDHRDRLLRFHTEIPICQS